MPRRPITRLDDDRYALRLDAHERRILGSLIEELREAIRDHEEALEEREDGRPRAADPASDPVARLTPPAFPEDERAQAAWSDLVGPSLGDARFRRMGLMETTIEADELDEAAAAAWLGTLNDLRLVLGGQLDITEDDEPPRDDDPDMTRRVIFDYLGWLVASFVDAMAMGLADAGEDDA